MPPELRRVVAYIAGSLAGGTATTSIYSFTEERHTSISGTLSDAQVALYDHERDAHITGSPAGLFHHRLASHFTVLMKGQSFTGYDFGSDSHYEGAVKGDAVELYDGREWHHYKLG
jgi:hypothetical protein